MTERIEQLMKALQQRIEVEPAPWSFVRARILFQITPEFAYFFELGERPSLRKLDGGGSRAEAELSVSPDDFIAWAEQTEISPSSLFRSGRLRVKGDRRALLRFSIILANILRKERQASANPRPELEQ